jgi:hypothetical protein
MPLIAYPIAQDGHDALAQLRAGTARCAAREKEAEALAGHRVAFVSQSLGPLYDSQEEASAAYKGLVADDGVCKLLCRLKPAAATSRKPEQPVFEDGARWPKVTAPRPGVWQLSVSYWKVMASTQPANAAPSTGDPARKLRKTAKGQDLTPEQIRALTETPMTAFRPQKSLDFGLFDFIPPDQPGIVIADE